MSGEAEAVAGVEDRVGGIERSADLGKLALGRRPRSNPARWGKHRRGGRTGWAQVDNHTALDVDDNPVRDDLIELPAKPALHQLGWTSSRHLAHAEVDTVPGGGSGLGS